MIFEVSSNRIRTFNSFTRGGSGRWEEHEIIHQKPLSEFIGPDLEQIGFTIRLDISHGVNPEKELKRLREIRDTGEVLILIIGGEPVTDNFWALRSLEEQHVSFGGGGELLLANAELTLKEYHVERWVWWSNT